MGYPSRPARPKLGNFVAKIRKHAMRFFVSSSLLPLVCCLLGACASSPRSLAAPEVYVSTLRVLPDEDGRRLLGVTLLLRNTNAQPVELRSIDFSVRLGSEGFFDGSIAVPTTVPASGDVRVQTTVSAEFVSSVSRLVSFLQGPESTLPYAAEGTLWLDTRPPRDLRFAQEGRVPLAMSATP
jgi:hypothetical protein